MQLISYLHTRPSSRYERKKKTGGKKNLQCIVKRQDANVSVYTLIILAGGETGDAVISVHIRDGNR